MPDQFKSTLINANVTDETTGLFVIVGSLVVIGCVEALYCARSGSARWNRWPANFALGTINIALASALPISAAMAARWAEGNGVGLFNHIAAPWWLTAAATVVVCNATFYLTHVVAHRVPALWRLHRVHHYDLAVDVSTGLRGHPLDVMFSTAIMLAVVLTFGLTPWAIVAYKLAETAAALLDHANVRLPGALDRGLRLVFVTPNMHSLHHSAHQPETDSNYGTIFSIWDRLFGTYRDAPVHGDARMQIGLAEIRDARAFDLWWLIKSPLQKTPPPLTEGAGHPPYPTA